jgi:hypothetical protein
MLVSSRVCLGGFTDGECKNLKCAGRGLDCCWGVIEIKEADLQDIDTMVGAGCSAHRFQVLLLAKIDCSLNLIEQWWGYGK